MTRLLVLFMLLALGAACTKKNDIPARDVLTRSLLDSVNGPMMLTEFETKQVSITMRPRSKNRSVTTWYSKDWVSLSFDNGVLIETRGLGDDLMSSDVSGTLRMLSGQMGDRYYERFETYLDGEYQSQFRSFRCQRTGSRREVIEIFERTQATTRTEETCYSPDLEYTNIYWRGSDGIMWKSQQWVSPSIKYLVTERLVR